MSDLSATMSMRRAHSCDQCNKSFSSTHQLAQHSRVHSGEKPYKCSYCERTFKQLSHVQQHTRLHTGERPYKCSISECGRAFIQLSNLQQHLKTHTSLDKIVKNSEKKFFCSYCGKGFKGQSSLITHQSKKHSDILNSVEMLLNKDSRNLITYSCQICSKTYLNEGSYKRHLETHQNSPVSNSASSSSISLWSCNACAMVFANEFGLMSHIDQMKSDPKHQHETQMMINRVNSDKKRSNNILANNFNTLVTDSGEQNISANMIAQNLLEINQNSNNQSNNSVTSSLHESDGTNQSFNSNNNNDNNNNNSHSDSSSFKY